MNLEFIKRGIAVATLSMFIVMPVQTAFAAEDMKPVVTKKQSKEINKNSLINVTAKIREQKNNKNNLIIKNSEEIAFTQKISNRIFVVTENNEALIYAEPNEESGWVGKAYHDSPVNVLEITEEWCLIESGNVTGYVRHENLIKGIEGEEHAKSILSAVYSEKDLFSLTDEEIEAAFSCAETKEEAAERRAREVKEKRDAVVSFAKRFIGNPYVYGGTSLTKGTDCSGFVGSVYRHFGVSLPRTSSGMRRAGYGVSVKDMQPGDILCYSGHVGIYIGGGKIVNAIDESKGIGISNAYYAPILAVRRIF